MNLEIIAALFLGYGSIIATTWIFIKFNTFKGFGKWLLVDFTGFRFIYEKLWPPDISKSGYRKAPTVTLWALGLYAAIFGIASQRYENIFSKNELLINSIMNQAATENGRAALSRIPTIQKSRLPYKPEINKPASVIKSLFVENEKDANMIRLSVWLLESNKKNLSNVNLNGIEICDADLSEANLSNAILKNVIIKRSNFRYAHLRQIRISGAIIVDTDFTGASFLEANVLNSDFTNCSFINGEFTDAHIDKTLFNDSRFWFWSFRGTSCTASEFKKIWGRFYENQELSSTPELLLLSPDYYGPKSETEYMAGFASSISEARNLYGTRFDSNIEEVVKRNCRANLFSHPPPNAPRMLLKLQN